MASSGPQSIACNGSTVRVTFDIRVGTTDGLNVQIMPNNYSAAQCQVASPRPQSGAYVFAKSVFHTLTIGVVMCIWSWLDWYMTLPTIITDKIWEEGEKLLSGESTFWAVSSFPSAKLMEAGTCGQEQEDGTSETTCTDETVDFQSVKSAHAKNVEHAEQAESSETACEGQKPDSQSVKPAESNVAEQAQEVESSETACEEEMAKSIRTTTDELIDRWLEELELSEDSSSVHSDDDDRDDDHCPIWMGGEKWDLDIDVALGAPMTFEFPKNTVMKSRGDGHLFLRFQKPTQENGKLTSGDRNTTAERSDSPSPASYCDDFENPIVDEAAVGCWNNTLADPTDADKDQQARKDPINEEEDEEEWEVEEEWEIEEEWWEEEEEDDDDIWTSLYA